MLRRFIREQFEQQQGNPHRGKEGEVHIIDKRNAQQNRNDGDGEYVDYEEL
ncbi:MAG: hypothetical protein H6606_02710 [Flavobacteriales bacterium]|nr:hypothetical protein [Flavobacteriales bacterium]